MVLKYETENRAVALFSICVKDADDGKRKNEKTEMPVFGEIVNVADCPDMVGWFFSLFQTFARYSP